MIVYLSRSGPPEALNCPVIMCDGCGKPIQGEPSGNVLWRLGADGHQQMAHTHKACTHSFERANPGEHWLADDLEPFLAQLTHNTAHPFETEDNVEYVAPPPFRWRMGIYRRGAR